MPFTAEDIVFAARDLAPEFRDRPVDPEVLARAFNRVIRGLVLSVTDADDERLAQEYAVDAEVVAVDPVDLTAVFDADTMSIMTGQREWLRILYIDYRGASGEGDEVIVLPIEARHRGAHDYAHLSTPVGFAADQRRQLHKLGGWTGVETLVVYGVLVPAKVTRQTLGSLQHDYPALLEDALPWALLQTIAPHIGVADARVGYFGAQLDLAFGRLEADAQGHIGSQVEAIPFSHEW